VFVFTHTQIDDAYEGHGIGSTLARGALDDVRRRGGSVVAQCPFIASYIDRHPEYADLLGPAKGGA
jgi:predicted GNAT family acetyltransferase